VVINLRGYGKALGSSTRTLVTSYPDSRVDLKLNVSTGNLVSKTMNRPENVFYIGKVVAGVALAVVSLVAVTVTVWYFAFRQVGPAPNLESNGSASSNSKVISDIKSGDNLPQ
jgi:cytoskeletal protein RodZ